MSPSSFGQAPLPVSATAAQLRSRKRDATQQLLGDTIAIHDDQWQLPSGLPGWTRAHVATHLRAALPDYEVIDDLDAIPDDAREWAVEVRGAAKLAAKTIASLTSPWLVAPSPRKARTADSAPSRWTPMA